MQLEEAMSHTPGPWAFGKKGRSSNFASRDDPIYRVTGDHMVLADVRSGAADALLITAAPDLLAALRTLSDSIATIPLGRGDTTVRHALTLAHAAITKATGAT